MIAIDDELISKMLENTLRFGVYGKVEQRRRQLNLFSPGNKNDEEAFNFNEGSGAQRDNMMGSPSNKEQSISLNRQGMSLEEMELLRRQNAELIEQIKKLQAGGKQGPQVVSSNGCCATTCNIF